MGRFIGRDTFAGVASAPQTGNRYNYALSNPFRYADPSGHLVKTIQENPGEFVSLAIAFTPVLGSVYGAYCGITGYDPIAGRELTPIERSLAFLPALGALGGVVGHAWRATEAEVVLGRAATRAESAAARVVAGGSSRYRPGRAIPAERDLGWALSSPTGRAERVVEKYGINLRASGQTVRLKFDPDLPLSPAGKVVSTEPSVIRFGAGAIVSEEELARTIAHELRHVRAYLGSGSNGEPAAEAAEDALAAFINGLR